MGLCPAITSCHYFSYLCWTVQTFFTLVVKRVKENKWKEMKFLVRWKRKHVGDILPPHKPATSNSTSNVTLLVNAASRRSWLASSRVPSSVGIPLIDKRRSPTCSRPHLQQLSRSCQEDRTQTHQVSINNINIERTDTECSVNKSVY